MAGMRRVFFTLILATFIVAILFPCSIAGAVGSKIIAIDPGHGGTDPGAIGRTGLREKDVNLSVGLLLRSLLVNDGFNVIMTRNNDTAVSLSDRCSIANEGKADIFISLHQDSLAYSSDPPDDPDRSVGGTTTYYWSDGVSKSYLGERLAACIQEELTDEIGRKDRGIKGKDFYVLRKTVMPASLVECCFISNLEEEKLLKELYFKNKIANGIRRGILRFFGEVEFFSNVWMYPNPFSPNGDGKYDTTSFCYTTAEDANVTIKVYNYKGEVKTIINDAPRKAGRHYEGWTGTNNQSSLLPNGNYAYTITAKNQTGTRMCSGITAIKNPVSRISNVWMCPNPFYPLGTNGNLKTTSFCYSLDRDAYVTIKVYNYKGEVKTVINDAPRKAGRHYEGWTGTNNSSNVLPPGNYGYTITAKNGVQVTSCSGITAVKK